MSAFCGAKAPWTNCARIPSAAAPSHAPVEPAGPAKQPTCWTVPGLSTVTVRRESGIYHRSPMTFQYSSSLASVVAAAFTRPRTG